MGYSHEVVSCQQEIYDDIFNGIHNVSKKLNAALSELSNIPNVYELYNGRQKLRKELDYYYYSYSEEVSTGHILEEEIDKLKLEIIRLKEIIEVLYKEIKPNSRYVDLYLELDI